MTSIQISFVVNFVQVVQSSVIFVTSFSVLDLKFTKLTTPPNLIIIWRVDFDHRDAIERPWHGFLFRNVDSVLLLNRLRVFDMLKVSLGSFFIHFFRLLPPFSIW